MNRRRHADRVVKPKIRGSFRRLENEKNKKAGVCFYRKARILPSTVLSCQCRSNMSVDSAVLAGRYHKMNMPCPSGPAEDLSSVFAEGG